MAVNTNHADYDEMTPRWKRMRDVIAGQDAMRSAASLYLRRPEGMEDEEWASYVKAADFYDATSRTMDGLTGMAFAEAPIATIPESMKAIRDDITLDGLSIDGLAELLLEEDLAVARVGVLVDYPEADPNVRTVRQAEQANRRPYATVYLAEQIFNWRRKRINGIMQTVEVRLKETVEIVDENDEFAVTIEDRIRVLQLRLAGDAQVYVQRVFVQTADKSGWIQESEVTPLMGGAPLPYIPFWLINPRDLTLQVVKPPMLGLAEANITHFKNSARLENVLSFCGAPQPYITGHAADTEASYTIGSSEAWVLPEEKATVDYLMIGNDGVEPLERRLTAIEQRMAMLGARMLSPDKKGVEAAETAQIHRQGEISVVAGICNRVSEALTEILKFIAEWAGIKVAKELSYKIQTNFFESALTADEAVKLMSLWQQRVIAYSDLLAALKKGRIVAPERTEELIAAENQSGPIQPLLLTGLFDKKDDPGENDDDKKDPAQDPRSAA